MSLKEQIETRKIGYAFSVTIEREIRTVTEAKYPDKPLVKASLEGNSETFEEAKAGLEEAKKKLLEVTKNE